jgi:CcmD family protein
MSEWNYVGAAYGLTWLVFAGYSLYLVARTRRARARLEHLTSFDEVER